MSFRITDNRTLPFFINGIVNIPFCVSAVIGNGLILVSFARTLSNHIKIKSLYLSVNVFSTAVLIEDTVNSETNILNQTETC